MSIGLAFRAFFAALSGGEVASRIQAALSSEPKLEKRSESAGKASPPSQPKKNQPKPPTRSDAITLLSTLQREARLLDLIQEPLDGFDDAQVGAAAREVLRDSRKTLERLFEIQPLSTEEEEAEMQVDEGTSPNRVRVLGGSAGKGVITHRGWQATKCELPKWTGNSNEGNIIAPTEVEIG